MKKLNGFLNIFLIWLGLILASCLSPGKGGKQSASCLPGQQFDSISRSCVGAIAGISPPIPLTTSVSIEEDSGPRAVNLAYTDTENDLATSCQARSVSGSGIRKQITQNGIQFRTRDLVDPRTTGIFWFSSSFSSVSVSGGNVFINYRSIDTPITIFSLLQGSAQASLLFDFQLINAQSTLSSFSQTIPEDLACSCSGGQCQVIIEPHSDFFGSSDFSYSLTDDDGTSAFQISLLNISPVNDGPRLLPGANLTFTMIEGTSRSNTFIAEGIQFFDPEGDSISSISLVPGLGLSEGVNPITDVSNDSYFIRPGSFVFGNPADSFSIQACDTAFPIARCSEPVEITLNIDPVESPLIGSDLSGLPSFDEDTRFNEAGNSDILNLSFSNPDSSGARLATDCRIDTGSTSGVFVSTPCECIGLFCRVGITGKNHFSGAASFTYRVSDGNPVGNSFSIDPSRVDLVINPVPDRPVVFGTASNVVAINSEGVNVAVATINQTVQFPEPTNNSITSVNFDIDPAFDPDGNAITSYQILSGPERGVLSNCMGLDGSLSTDLSCTYTPLSGNLSDAGDFSDADTDDNDRANTDTTSGAIRFLSNIFGVLSYTLNVRLIHSPNTAGAEEAWLDGDTVFVIYDGGVTTLSTIVNVIATTANVNKVLSARAIGLSTSTLSANDAGTYTITGGVATADSFEYTATDSTGLVSEMRRFNISITPVDDRPVICEFSTHQDEPDCGLNGCVGDIPPQVAGIVAQNNGATYYETAASTCWQSNNAIWAPVESHIRDRNINELQSIVIDRIKVDEGGGDASEDTQVLRLVDIDSSNPSLIPEENVQILYDGSSTCDSLNDNCGVNSALPLSFGVAGSDDQNQFSVIINPVAGQTGTATIEITLSDGNLSTDVEFNVNVFSNAVSHGGWRRIGAVGPKTTIQGQLAEDKNHCPYSLDLCEGGRECRGGNSPVNNTAFSPDDVNSIYLQESGQGNICYRVGRTQLQDISFAPKTSNYVSIQYENSAEAGSESIALPLSGSGTVQDPFVVRVRIADDVTTTDVIKGLIEGNTQTNALISVINMNPGEDQDDSPLTTINNLSESSWEVFSTPCLVTPTDFEPACSVFGESCQGGIDLSSTSPNPAPTRSGSFYYNEGNGSCFRSARRANGSLTWLPYEASAEVNLAWNSFSVQGVGTINRYEVFRRQVGESFNFSKRINRNIILAQGSVFTYDDNHLNSFSPPAPNTVYFYEVRAVVANVDGTEILSGTNEVFREARVIAPPNNMAFAHRWMMNREMCEYMKFSPDATNNYRCEYQGPGDTLINGVNFYDIGQDFLVDRHEAGCAYSPSPACNTTEGSCVGVNNPTADPSINRPEVIANDGSVYYSRGEGQCYIRTSGNWLALTGAAQVSSYLATNENAALNVDNIMNDQRTDRRYIKALLPPLNNVTQEDAQAFCQGLESIDIGEIEGIGRDLSHKLPSRKEQIAYSHPDLVNTNQLSISTREVGQNLNLSGIQGQEGCNGSGASGLEGGYSNVDIPNSSTFYSLPGTESSNIRTLVTGSAETSGCISQFGVQDIAGNVAEWTTERIVCENVSTCRVVTSADGALDIDSGDDNDTISSTADIFGRWMMDGIRGPCLQVPGPLFCNGIIRNWDLDNSGTFQGGLFVTALGLPANTTFQTTNPSSNTNLFPIDQPSGLNLDEDRGDRFIVESDELFAGGRHCGGLAAGGGSRSGEGSGSWTAEYIPCDGDHFGSLILSDVAFRARTNNLTTLSIELVPTASATPIDVSVLGNAITVTFNSSSDDGALATAGDLVAEINSDPAASNLIEAVLSGDSSIILSSSVGPRFLEAHLISREGVDTVPATNRRDDVGFRCLIPINPEADYIE